MSAWRAVAAILRRRGPHLRRGLAAEGAGIVGNEVGVAHDHGDSVEWNHQLLGHQLGQRGADVLADFDLAGEDGYLTIGRDVQPRRDCSGHLLATAKTCAGLLRQGGLAGEADQQAAAEEFEECAAVQRKAAQCVAWFGESEIDGIVEKGIHRAPPFAKEWEACCTACTMRG